MSEDNTASDLWIENVFKIRHMQARMIVSEICCGNKKPQTQKLKMTILCIYILQEKKTTKRETILELQSFSLPCV